MLPANKYVLLTSLVGTLTVIALLALFRHVTFTALIEHETRSNVALTRVFVNLVWPGYRDFAARAPGFPRASLRERPEIKGLHRAIADLLHGSRVIAVKLHDVDGLTVFSSDAARIGESASAAPGFAEARGGRPASRISFRERVDGFEGPIVDRNVVSSLVPVRDEPGSPIGAVFEVYSDVTPLVHELRVTLWTISIGVLTALALLYALVFAIVRRADRTIHRQEHERVRREAQIRHQTYNDALTGLPNRVSLARALGERLGNDVGPPAPAILLAVGLDRFKLVNDGLGHDHGDEVLRRVSARLTRVVRGEDAVHRMGGDEFAVLPRGLDFPDEAVRLAERILGAVREPLEVGGQRLIVTASIGVATCPHDAPDSEGLVRNAVVAMSTAKESGGNAQLCYQPDMNARSLEQLALQTELTQALERDEFVLHYQPRVNAASRRIVCLEALLRWQSPTRGLVGPGAIIPVLERTGLMVAVGEWVLHEACRQASAWHSRGVGLEAISVNVSARQLLSGGLAGAIAGALARSGLPARCLELEITERVLIEGFEDAAESMREIKALGVGLSLDDFGTGYSSFDYLKRLPVDQLKLDRSLVQGIEDDPRDLAIVQTIAALAHGLDLGVVAEGVERAGQEALLLTACRCEQLQGFLYGRPAPPLELEAQLFEAAARGRAVA